ncbi:ABC transporter transmembrane domain-containing protein [Desulfobacter postgatei]|jgi:ABC-type multidrug transport system fused ATPase/permease subunit|uniref:ABC transporter transmembrane domain-containing protein n=1 Tax=Desulfobacter postgatei TaxID=2293 RepID=UPI002A35F904|nr:ABC transporter transmembrane domain-containing protein [Desulfobacter postgatei]MDX9965180.1 ABC transporter transmembrane domain-containing protein [Desulfobacter postgatei]
MHFKDRRKNLTKNFLDLVCNFPNKPWVLSALTLSLASSIISPILIGRSIDSLSSVDENVQKLIGLLLGMLGLIVLSKFSRYSFDCQLAENTLTFEKTIRLYLWDGLSRISIGKYESLPRGALHSKMNRDVSLLSMSIRVLLEAVFTSVVIGTWAIIWTAFHQPSILALVAIAMIVNCLIYCLFRGKYSG